MLYASLFLIKCHISTRIIHERGILLKKKYIYLLKYKKNAAALLRIYWEIGRFSVKNTCICTM